MRHPLSQLLIANTVNATHAGAVLPMSSACVMGCDDGGNPYGVLVRAQRTPNYEAESLRLRGQQGVASAVDCSII